MRLLPNALSCLRIALSAALPFLANNPWLFAAAYLLCGLTDALDGYIARRFHVESSLGARLDSLGDLVFFAASVYLVWPLLYRAGFVLLCVAAIAIVRIGNIALTRYKFHIWSAMHTVGNKIAGGMIFLALPACVLLGRIPLWIAIPVCGIALLSALEETVLLLRSDRYDANRPSLFGRK
jgi:phosphatidylglycerophosphate synthase